MVFRCGFDVKPNIGVMLLVYTIYTRLYVYIFIGRCVMVTELLRNFFGKWYGDENNVLGDWGTKTFPKGSSVKLIKKHEKME